MEFALLIFAIVGGLLVTWAARHRFATIEDAASTYQAILTAAAIILAGYWYFVERKGLPHADVTQKVDVVRIAPDLVAAEVHVSIKNLGSTLVRPEEIDIRLQQVSPIDKVVAGARGLPRDSWPSILRDGTPLFNEAELQWTVIRFFRKKVDREVEPGETDVIAATFLVPCSTPVVRVVSAVAKSAARNQWWRSRSFVNIGKACAAESREVGDGAEPEDAGGGVRYP